MVYRYVHVVMIHIYTFILTYTYTLQVCQCWFSSFSLQYLCATGRATTETINMASIVSITKTIMSARKHCLRTSITMTQPQRDTSCWRRNTMITTLSHRRKRCTHTDSQRCDLVMIVSSCWCSVYLNSISNARKNMWGFGNVKLWEIMVG